MDLEKIEEHSSDLDNKDRGDVMATGLLIWMTREQELWCTPMKIEITYFGHYASDYFG